MQVLADIKMKSRFDMNSGLREKLVMPESKNTSLLIGLMGILILLVSSLAYSAWESNSQYQPDQIKQLVDERSNQKLP